MDDSNILARYLDLRFTQQRAEIMSEVSDKIAEASRSFDEAQARVEAAVAQLRAEVDALKAESPTGADMAALDDLDRRIDALDPTKPTTLPEE